MSTFLRTALWRNLCGALLACVVASCAARPAPIVRPTVALLPLPVSDGAVPPLEAFFCPQPEQRPRKPLDQFGYGISTNWSVGDIGYWNNVISYKLGFDWIGIKINWDEFEPERTKPNLERWSLLDAFVADANWRGLNVLFTVTHPPQWSRAQVNAAGLRPSPSDEPAELARFAGTLVTRYRRCLHALEIYNEVNLGRDWRVASGEIHAADYARILTRVVPALRAGNPDVRLVMAAPSPSGGSAQPGVAQDDFTWLDEFVAAGGLQYVDCVGVHLNGFNMPPTIEWDAGYDDRTALFRGPFDNPHHSWSFISTLKGYRQKTQKPLCITEFGWASMDGLGVAGAPAGFDFARDNTAQEQADFTVQAFELLRTSGYVQFGVVFNLDYIIKTSVAPDQDAALPYSLLNRKGSPRPVFDALERMSKR